MNDDKIKALYNQLKDDGYTLDNEDTFREDLQNDESFRRQIYNSQKKDGYDMGGNFNSWQGRLMKSFSAPSDNNKQQTPKQSPNTSAGSHAQQVVNEYDESVRREQRNNTISNNQQARTQFVPEASNVRGATIPKDSPLRQQYPYLRDISDKDQVYFRTDTNEPLFTWADNEGKDLTQEEAAMMRQRAEIEQDETLKPHQVPLTSLQLPEGSAVGIKTDMKVSDYADELLKKQYGENYSQGTLTDANGNSISTEELRNNLAQQTYNDLNKDVADARRAINEAGYDKQAIDKIVNNISDKWKGLVGKERMTNALMQGNEPDARQPDLFDSISKSVRAGFIRAGAGLLDTMQSLASNLYVEDASSPTGYSRTRSYAEALADKNDPLTQASNYINKRADTLSREAQPYQGQKGFLDMLWDGDIEGFLQKGVATAGESLPMTLSAFNPYTMTINAISMAGNNFRNNTLENPDIPAWKRAAMAIGSAAIEQATEKYSDPIFKYIGGNKILRGSAKKYAQSVTNDVTQKATETLARRIYNRLANITKDAVGEGLEEVIGNVGNDVLGQTLDLISGNEDYGLKAQWNQAKKENPDITLADFAKNKAKESIESFIGGAMAGAYTSGSAQLTNKALQYTFDTLGGAEETQATGRINPINVDVAQSYDDGYTAEESNELNNTKIRYEFNRDKVAVTLGVTPEQVDETIGDPIEFISKAQQEGRVQAVQPVIDYINSKASYDGMIDRVRDDIDSRIEASNKLIKERTNISTKMIQPATLKAVSEDGKDQVVYVVGGNVTMLDDGTGVDKEKSDGSIPVRHADTNKLEMVSPDAILKVDAPIDPQVERETAAQNIRMTYAQNKADSIDGKVAFAQGDVYTLTDEAGKVAQVTVVPNKDGIVDNGDGTVNVDAGTGEVVAMPKDAIQSMVDATNYNKVAQESEGGIQQGQQEISYEAGDEIKVTDDNGNVVTASIMQSRDPEGRYLIQTETPINGQKVNKFSASEIEAIKYTEPAEQNAPVQDVQSPTEQSSVPIDNEGRPVYEEAEPSAAWNAIMQEANNDMQLAQNVVDSMVADKEAELSKLEKSKAKGGKTISEKIAAENARQAAIEQARASLAQWRKIQQQAQQPQATTTEQPAAEQAPAEQVTEQPSAEQQPANEQQVEQTQAATAQEEQKSAIPTDEKGNMLYHQVPVETTINDLYDGSLDDNEIRDFVDANISEADKNLEKINKKTPKIGINKAEYLKKKQEWQKQVEDATRIRDYWNGVKDYIAQQTHTTPEEVKAAQDELSGEAARREYQDMGGSVQQDAVSVASDFIRDAKITPESFKAETGYGTDEQRKFVGIIAKAEKGGKTIDRLAEELVSYDNAEMNGVLFGGDTSSAKDAILSALQGAGTRGELKQTNEAEEQAYIDARNAARDAQYMEQYGMTYEEYLAYEEQIMPTIWREYNNYDETAFNNMYAEEIEQLIKSRENDTTGEEQADDRGNQVLSEQQVTEQRGSADGTEPGTEVQAGVQGTDENAVAPEEASGERIPNIERGRQGYTGYIARRQQNNLETSEEINVPLSQNEQDEYGNPMVLAENGSTVFGTIESESGLTEAPIKLSLGENKVGTDGKNHGYGLLHIEAGHGEQIRNAGYQSVEQFVENVAQNYTDIKEGALIGKKQTYLLEVSDEHNNTLFIQLSNDGTYWNVNSAGIFKKKYSRRKPLIYTVPAVGKSTVTDTSEVNSGQSMGATAPAGNSSESKDSDKSAVAQTIDEKIAKAEEETDVNPTEAQKEAGNYKKGHVKIDGYDVTIEQPKGSVRRGTDADGKQWEQTMNNTYGYIRGTEGVDGDHIDIFLSENPTEGNVYVVDQVNPDGSFDEHKVMYGFQSAEDARAAYLSNYEEGWQGLGTITEVSKEEFKKWINSSHRKTKPFAEYKSVKADGSNESDGRNESNASKEDGGGVRLRLGENGAKPLSAEETAIRDAVVGRLRESGLEVITDAEEGQWVLDEANGRNVRLNARKKRALETASVSLNETSSTAISSADGAKIRKDAETAIENDRKIREQRNVRFFRTPNGEAYGFTVGGKIYIDPRVATADTPIHEYAHLWASALRQGNPEEWRNVVGLMKGTPVWDEVRRIYPELTADDDIADEVLATYSGRRGAERLKEETRKAMDGKGVFDAAQAVTAMERVKEALRKFWKDVADFLHIHYTSAEEVADRVMSDLLEGRPLPKSTQGKDDIRYRFIGEQGAANLDAAEEATTRLDNLSTARQMEQAYNDKKARIEKLKDSKPVEITGKEIEPSDDLKQYKKNALEYGKKLQGSYVNKDTGRPIQLQRGRRNGGVNEVLQHDYKDVEHLQSVAAIPQIIENSVYIDSRENTDKEKNPNVTEYQYYVCGLKIGDADYTVRSTIAVDNKGNRYYDHKLTSIEKGKLLDQINGQTAKNVGFGTMPGTKPTTDKSLGKDKVLLSLLQTNDEENARKIKFATGWERGADGKWRYETTDFEYHPKGDARRNDKYKESEWYKELHVLEEKLFNGETLTDGETKRFDELSARVNDIRDNDRNTERIYLDDYVEDNELFKAYPELKQTKIDFVDLPNEGYSAKYNEKENRITVNQAKSIDDKSAIAHEVQHAIQHIEGFAKGSNVDNYNSVPTSENVINDIIDATDGHILDGGGFDNTTEGIFNALNRKTTYGTILRDYSSELDDIANKYGYETIFDLVNDIDKFKSRVEMYLSEAGEVEARNVEARINMTPEQRRQSLASETEDVAREDQTFLQDALGTRERYGTDGRNETNGQEAEEANRLFNEELQQLIDGTLPKGHVFELGRPSNVLRSAGVPNLPIEMAASRLSGKSRQDNHPFELSEVKDLPQAIQKPMAVFRSATHIGSYVVMTEIEHNGKNFVVAIETNMRRGRIEVNSIRSVHYRTSNVHMANWITEGLLEYADKGKMAEWFSKQRYNSADVRKLFNHAANIVKNFENPSVGEENLRSGEGILTDAKLSYENDPVAKLTGNSTRTAEQQRAFAERERERMISRVQDLAKKLHLDNVEIVTDTSKLKGRRAKAKGFYSRDNGKIVIVVPNHVDMADIEQTVLHEAVAHYGLRKLFGSNFDTFLYNVYNNADENVRREIVQLAAKHNWDFATATEEYLASLAENTNFEDMNASWWNKIKDLFLSMVRSIGLKGFSGKTLSDNELRYILWRSYENLKNPGRYRNVFGGTEDIAMQNRLKVGNYAIFDDKSKVAEPLYRESDGTSPLSGSIIEAWDKTAKSMKFQLKETFVDYLNALDKFQKLVEKYSKKKIQEFENAYDWMSFLSSKNRQEMDAFDSFIVKPLNNAISKIIGEETAEKKWNWEEGPLRELVMYVEAKHGTDRNRQMAVEKFINDFEEDLSFFEKADINFDKEGYDRELGKAGKDAYEKAYRKEFEKITKEISAEFSDEQRNDVENRAAKAGEKASEKAKEKFKQETVEKLNKQYKEKLYKDWIKSKKDINSLPNITWAEKQKLLDSAAQAIGADISQDYSGLSSVFGDKEQYPNPWEQEAVDFVERYEQNHTTENLDEMWNAIDNATGYALQKQYESGLVSKEYIERQKERFDNYIPLRGFADEVAGDVYNYMENEFYPGGNPVKSAHGRTSEAGNPFGSILNTAYSSISSGNKNMAKMAFYSMVANHDTQGLAVAQKAWMIKYSSLQDDPELMSVVKMPEIEAGEDVPEWVEAVPKLPSDVNLGESAETEKMRTEMLNNFEQVMKRLQREGAAKPISKKSKVRYKTLFKQRDEHEIPLFIAGDKYIVTITGNPRVAQAINGLLNPDVENDGLTQLAKRTQQLMSAAFTAKNPAFSIANLSKDTIDANNQVFIRENPRYWAKFAKNQKAGFGAYPKMMSMLHQYQNGTLDLTKGDSKLFKEFMDNGGATGYTFVNTQDEYAKELAKKLKHLSESAPRFFSAKATLKTVFDAIEFAGQSAELVNRFAAYKTSRNMGRAINRSIRDAKEITVNFNRKGAGRKSVDKNKSWYSPINIASAISQYGRTNILFWNAGIQAKYKLYRNLKDHPIKTSVSLMGGCLALSALGLPLLNNMLLPALYAIFGFGSDDDKEDYYNALTDWERTHNICVRLPKGWWLKIPLSPEMTPWVTMGDAIGGAVSGQRELSSSDFIKSVIDVTSPISINWQYKPEMMPLNFAPTVTQPILQNMMNVNFMGNPIKKTSFDRFKDYKPEYLMVYKSTSPTFIELSRLSNRLGGGKDNKTSENLADWNPALLQNFITGYTGGYGQTFISIADWIVNTSKGEEQAVTFSRMPLVSRFAISGNKDVKITRINQKYNEVRKFIGEFDYDKKTYKEEVKKAREEHDLMKEAEAISNYEQLLRSKRASLYLRLKSTDKSLKKYEEYLEEFPDDEQTKNLYMNIKTDAVELFKNERP